MPRTDSPFGLGVKLALPFIAMVIPFAMLFGVVATEAGLNVVEVLAFSIAAFAGVAQFTAVQLLTENVPTAIILISALAVNLRMAMYSASITPYLGATPTFHRAILAYFLVDQNYALSATEFEKRTEWTLKERLAFYWGVTIVIVPFWYGGTLAGALIGSTIPEEFALDFALPICFLAMIGPALRTPAHIAAALTAGVFSLVFMPMPHGLAVPCAGLVAMMVGAEVERRMAKGKT